MINIYLQHGWDRQQNIQGSCTATASDTLARSHRVWKGDRDRNTDLWLQVGSPQSCYTPCPLHKEKTVLCSHRDGNRAPCSLCPDEWSCGWLAPNHLKANASI